MSRETYNVRTVARRSYFSREKFIAITISMACAVAAALLAQDLFEPNAGIERVVQVQSEPKPSIATTKVVVARTPLKYGTSLKTTDLEVVDWPVEAVPEGSYASVADFFDKYRNRVVLTRMGPKEPVVEWKVSGPDRRPGLAGTLSDGMKAATIRVTDHTSVAGFVRPGDLIDILVTHTEQKRKEGGKPKKITATDVLLRGVRVLAADQIADETENTPSLSKTITVEVDLRESQLLALGASVGELSVVLRNPSAGNDGPTGRITVADLRGDKPAASLLIPTSTVATPTPNHAPVAEDVKVQMPKVTVIRATKGQDYDVPAFGDLTN